MIARKILDRVDEPLDASEEPYESLLLHPPPLQIKTSSITNMKRALRDRTNSVLPPTNVISPDISTNVPTPDSSHAFGSPTMKPNRFIRLISSCGSSRDSLRREWRYSLAEQALSDALKRCTSERSSRELQILALEKAASAMSARANESRERAAELKFSLADRTVDPDRYATLQSDRWMEERRQCVADLEFRQLSQHLASLKSTKGLPEQRSLGENPSPLDNEARRRANLVQFFERSPTRISFHFHHKCRPLFVDCTFSRRMTMSDVSPLRLRPSAVTLRFTAKHALPTSVHGAPPPVPTRRSSKPWAASGPSKPSSLFRTTRYSTSEHSSTSLTQSPTPSSRLLPCNDHTDDVTPTRPPTPPLSVTSTSSNGASRASRAPSQPSPEAPSGGGVATIYASTSPRSHTEILAELDKDSVCVPEYAVNLLEGFDLIHHDLALPERDLSSKRREEEPAAVAPPPSEESDTGPYTSFALEPGPLWSHTSLNTSSTPRSHVPTLHPVSSGSSTPSGMSMRTTPKTPASPLRPASLLFLMRKRKEQYSPASSMSHLDEESSRGSKRRFSLFSRK